MKRIILILLLISAVPAYSQFNKIFAAKKQIDIPVDSLKLYIEFAKNRGLGLSTFGQLMPSLYCHGTRNGDTLQLGNTSGSSSDDPTDSTVFGYLYFDGTNDGAVTTQQFYLYQDFTIIIKWHALNTSYFFGNEYTGSSNWVIMYSSTGNSFEIRTQISDYRSNWAISNDSVYALTNEGDLYLNGVKRVNNAFTWITRANKLYVGTLKFTSFFGRGRLGTFAVYNRKLSDAEVLQWNP